MIVSSGVMWSQETKEGLLKYAPQLMLVDSLRLVGGDRHGPVDHHRCRVGADRQVPALGHDAVIRRERCSCSTPSRARKGLVGVGGPQPVGYYKDPEKSARTFVETPHGRFSVPGDWAQVNEDGQTLTLLGRGSVCINTGGEKVFPEEVEEVVKRAEGVRDCVVVGVPDERFGEAITAVVSADTAARRRGAEALRQAAPGRATRRRSTSSSSTRCTAARPARRTSSAPRTWPWRRSASRADRCGCGLQRCRHRRRLVGNDGRLGGQPQLPDRAVGAQPGRSPTRSTRSARTRAISAPAGRPRSARHGVDGRGGGPRRRHRHGRPVARLSRHARAGARAHPRLGAGDQPGQGPRAGLAAAHDRGDRRRCCPGIRPAC